VSSLASVDEISIGDAPTSGQLAQLITWCVVFHEPAGDPQLPHSCVILHAAFDQQMCSIVITIIAYPA
jgi:hypothetical protein